MSTLLEKHIVELLREGDDKAISLLYEHYGNTLYGVALKVVRDEEMYALDGIYPGYGFARHKGYPTREHVLALEKLGICPIHRRSFAPVNRLI